MINLFSSYNSKLNLGGSISCGFEYLKNKGLSDANLLRSSTAFNETFPIYQRMK